MNLVYCNYKSGKCSVMQLSNINSTIHGIWVRDGELIERNYRNMTTVLQEGWEDLPFNFYEDLYDLCE